MPTTSLAEMRTVSEMDRGISVVGEEISITFNL